MRVKGLCSEIRVKGLGFGFRAYGGLSGTMENPHILLDLGVKGLGFVGLRIRSLRFRIERLRMIKIPGGASDMADLLRRTGGFVEGLSSIGSPSVYLTVKGLGFKGLGLHNISPPSIAMEKIGSQGPEGL